MVSDHQKDFHKSCYEGSNQACYLALAILLVRPFANLLLPNLTNSSSYSGAGLKNSGIKGLLSLGSFLHSSSMMFAAGLTFTAVTNFFATKISLEPYQDTIKTDDKYIAVFTHGATPAAIPLIYAWIPLYISAVVSAITNSPKHNMFYPYSLPFVAMIAALNGLVNFKNFNSTGDEQPDVCYSVIKRAFWLGGVLAASMLAIHCTGSQIFKISFNPRVNPIIEIATPLLLAVYIKLGSHYVSSNYVQEAQAAKLSVLDHHGSPLALTTGAQSPPPPSLL